MALLADLVLETTNAPGTGTCNLLGAQTDRVSFYTGFGSPSSALVYYVLDDNSQSEWGVGTFTHGSPDTVARTTVIGNTSGNTSRLNFTGLTKIYNSLPAARTVYVDNSNNVVVPAGGHFGSVAGGMPVGAGMPFFGASAPAGWLFCNGQQVSRSVYAALFAVMGTTYGAADGVTYFNVPDYRGRVPAGVDNMGGGASAARMAGVCASTTMGTAFGDQWLHAHGHTVAVNDAIHTHGVTDPTHSHGVIDPQHQHGLPGTLFLAGSGLAFGAQYATGLSTTNFASTGISLAGNSTGVTINNAWSGVTTGTAAVNGAGVAQNVQPTLFCNYIVFAGV